MEDATGDHHTGAGQHNTGVSVYDSDIYVALGFILPHLRRWTKPSASSKSVSLLIHVGQNKYFELIIGNLETHTHSLFQYLTSKE